MAKRLTFSKPPVRRGTRWLPFLLSVFFLSRLYGGEQTKEKRATAAAFLSRLCGGELISVAVTIFNIFLSRLCGGEQPETRPARHLELSKPPVRRGTFARD